MQARAKDPTSFGKKVVQPSDADASKPKYDRPLEQIFDLSGVRIIAHFPKTLHEIDEVLKEEFEISERSDKGAMLLEEERFGYQYKSAVVIPVEIRRRFMALAGVLEIADREFQAIQDADSQLTAAARSAVQAGQLSAVEITPDALRAFLDQRLGPDGRISDFSYDWLARLVRRLGFRTLAQIESCIEPYDDDALSRLATGGRREGQASRLENMLLAGMGEKFRTRHLYAEFGWFLNSTARVIAEFEGHGIPIGDFDPLIQN